jgi:regulator of protease activity HflC (stomatin/prohibitin superfamily)
MPENEIIGFLPVVFVLLAFIIIAAKSFARVQPNERLVVLRLGKLLSVCGPGLNIVLPFVDHAIRVDVEKIAGWRGLSERELRKKAEQIALDANSR